MKKLFLMVMAAVALGACEPKQGAQSDALVQTIDSLTRVNEQKDNEINDMLTTLNDIEEGFRQISQAQGRVTVARQGEGTSQAARMREDLQFIQQTMTQNTELINKLRLRLRESTINSDQLKRTVENLVAQLNEKSAELQQLRDELAAKDVHIAELDEQVATLTEDLATLENDNAEKTQTIDAQDRQLHTAWFVFGTKAELKRQNILKSGEVLQEDFSKSYFTQIDTRVDKEIKLMSRDARILTTHPKGSYKLDRDANKQYVLRITNADAFWSTSRYLVIQVK